MKLCVGLFLISVWECNKIVIDIVSMHAYFQIISRGHGFRSETCDKEKNNGLNTLALPCPERPI